MVARATPATHKVGPFDVSHTTNELVLRLEKRGELSAPACLMFVLTMVIILLLGVMSILHTHGMKANGVALDDPSFVFAPARNYFALLWLVSSLLMIVVLPLYVVRAYNSALIYTFRRSDNAFLKGKQRIARLKHIENISIRETRDPDRKYLYYLNIVYNDGQQMLLYNGYDERTTMNLSNEISAFIGCPVKWKEGRR